VTARRTKGGVVVSVKVKDLKTAKNVARRLGAVKNPSPSQQWAVTGNNNGKVFNSKAAAIRYRKALIKQYGYKASELKVVKW
jgi:predicted lactoylglutathione lyase